MGGKKNRSSNSSAEDKDKVIAKLTQQLAESNKEAKEFQKQVTQLLARFDKKDREEAESGGGAASAAAKKKQEQEADRKAAERKKEEEKRQKEQEREKARLAGDTLDEEWEVVDREAKREKAKAEKSKAEASIHGATLLPAQIAAKSARSTPVVQEEGPDPGDWSVEIRPVAGKERLKVGQPGLVFAQNSREITQTLHDLQATDQPAAMLSYDKTADSILAPVRMWKDGKASLKRLWLTHLGTGENGQVQYIGTTKEEEDGGELEEEEWEEQLSTEVMVLRVHQAWCSKDTWTTWAPNATRMTVARKWLRRQKLDQH